MKISKFSEAQVMKILGEVGAGKSVREVCTAHGLSEAALYAWKRKNSGIETNDVKQFRDLDSSVGYIPSASFRAQFLAFVRATPSLQPETAPTSSTSL